MNCEKKDCIYHPININCANCGIKHRNYHPELARQVPDGEIQAAINWLESEKGHRIREYEKSDDEWKNEPGSRELHEEHCYALDLSIAALRQYRKPELCEICGNAGGLALITAHMPSRWNNHCPNCGRKLGGD